ncbi:LEA type 2 family protein [Eisenibacter elegans]|jgi:LEA14-like dessication related protein|uniref:NDR1/HIN1-like protein n=1 Tax=Eisenibacter elegans TaxID=997 RepID=UPI00040B5C35|nr:LEA type 2 family protein [Eisenibacter elegans]
MKRLLLFLSLLSLSACYQYPEVVAIDSVKVLDVKNDSIFLEVQIEVYNPNKFTVSLNNIDTDIEIKKLKLGHSVSKGKLALSPEQNTATTLMTSLSLKDAAHIYPEIIDKDSILVGLTGNYQWQTWFGAYNFSYTQQNYMSPKRLTAQTMKQVLLDTKLGIKNYKSQLGTEQIYFNILLQIENPYSFDLGLDEVNVDINIPNTDTKLTQWRLPQGRIIKSRETALVSVKVFIESKNLVLILPKLYLDGKPTLAAEGMCKVNIEGETFELPIKHHLTLPYIRLM